ncbi:VOC family protein [Alkalicoccobacillus porphyridii]|uniref:VOC family protein n=1 Tax=Alkalicoccobacillus porphyridii TaxID=2597270 RepID=A0A553ZWJ0_9BACI|nr:VOC family protein [Alkalicoccobacillus porphyridii]TSB45725.1 VOC family protein [Alkalicoccobacillus porphyridii]
MTLSLTPYVTLAGQAREAIQFYEKVLEAKVLGIMTYADMPGTPAEMKDLIANAAIQVGESSLMLSDTPEPSIQEGKKVTICITSDDAEKSKRIFADLAEGGHINMPLEETSFSPAFGDVTDKFGVTFQIYTESK